MEMADGLVINKADGIDLDKAKQAQIDYKNALHLFSASESGWTPQVHICSSLNKTGIDKVWKIVSDHNELLIQKSLLNKIRNDQNVTWFREQISQSLMSHFFANENNLELKKELEVEINIGGLTPKEALARLLEGIIL